ncbi:hypothetical protein KIN20_024649 [Parelaphostrongylus tenuis]|uniref:Uncharacterized protein n=1 Tax=Parelaphostrongylus tenuis TaxID=148309 RepID=A0AAD5QTS6_PARTN|nr:hypothetical protein KIN20_024649 [Parelaphostrongylus tenuis]
MKEELDKMKAVRVALGPFQKDTGQQAFSKPLPHPSIQQHSSSLYYAAKKSADTSFT